jgi:hypothetical protein
MRIYRCKSCTRIHIEAGNAYLNFLSPERLTRYLDYLESIDAAHYAALNRRKGLSKEVILHTEDASVNVAFTLQEFEELKLTIRNYLANPETGCKSAVQFQTLSLHLN